MEILEEFYQLKKKYGDAFQVHFYSGFEIRIQLRDFLSKSNVEFKSDSTILRIKWTEKGVDVYLEPEDGISDVAKLLALLQKQVKGDPEKGSIEGMLAVVTAFLKEQSLEGQTSEEQSLSPIFGAEGPTLCSIYAENFQEFEKLGKGGFGTVFECKNKLDEVTYAVKKIPFSEGGEKTILREVKALYNAQHKNVVRYIQAWIEDGVPDGLSYSGSDASDGSSSSIQIKTLYLLMEFCSSTLENEIDGLDEKKIWPYFKNIVEGVCYIHHQSMTHGDLTRSNIFIDEFGTAKIGDFGLAVMVGDPPTRPKTLGNPIYQAPELKDELPFTNKVDIYALGIILFEMSYPMKTGMERDNLLNKIKDRELPLDWYHEEKVSDLLFKLLESNPDERPTAAQILETVASW